MQDFNTRRPLPVMTALDMQRGIEALGLPDGWSRVDDVALMEGLFRGDDLGRIGARIDKPLGEVQARFLVLRRLAMDGENVLSLTAQERLLEAVWALAKRDIAA